MLQGVLLYETLVSRGRKRGSLHQLWLLLAGTLVPLPVKCGHECLPAGLMQQLTALAVKFHLEPMS